MTKKQAALQLLAVTKRMREALAGDDDADLWILMLETIAYDLDAATFSRYADLSVTELRLTKIRRLIEHPDTSSDEREAAVAALSRIRGQEASRA